MKRRLLASTALVLAGTALAACSGTSSSNPLSPAQTTAVAGVINTIANVLNYAQPVVPLIALVVPAAAPFVPLAQGGLTVAENALKSLAATMTAVQAQPGVGTVFAGLNTFVAEAQSAIDLIPDPAKKAQATSILAVVKSMLHAIQSFATGVASTIAVPTVPVPAAARYGAVAYLPPHLVIP